MRIEEDISGMLVSLEDKMSKVILCSQSILTFFSISPIATFPMLELRERFARSNENDRFSEMLST
jgi:hypothetical protein